MCVVHGHSSSAVNWAAMMMGAALSLTGYTEWGSQTPGIPSRETSKYGMFPTIFELMHDQKPDSEIGVIYTWSGIGYLFQKAVDYLKSNEPNLLFLHFDDVDGVGHGIGWGADDYFKVIEKMDERIGKILETLESKGMMDKTLVFGGRRSWRHGAKSWRKKYLRIWEFRGLPMVKV